MPQKIAVDQAAAGMRVDCPACASTLIIPPTGAGAVIIAIHRKLAPDALHQKLEKQKTELGKAVAESVRLRQEHDHATTEREKFRTASEATARELKALGRIGHHHRGAG